MDEPVEDYDLMEVVVVRADVLSESNEKIFDYLQGVFMNDKEKIMKQVGSLPDHVMKEVDSMSGVGALMVEKGRQEGERKGRVKALYYDAEFSIEEIAEKTQLSEDEIRSILSQEDD